MFLPVIVIVVFPAAIPLVGLKLVSVGFWKLHTEIRESHWLDYGNRSTRRKLSPVKLDHIMLYRVHLAMSVCNVIIWFTLIIFCIHRK
jgi:hypothetical protein